MFDWKKKGLVFDVSKYRNGSWLDSFAQAPSCLVFDDFVRIYSVAAPHLMPLDNLSATRPMLI